MHFSFALAGGFDPLTGQSLSRAGKISSCVNWLSAREKIGPVNERNKHFSTVGRGNMQFAWMNENTFEPQWLRMRQK